MCRRTKQRKAVAALLEAEGKDILTVLAAPLLRAGERSGRWASTP